MLISKQTHVVTCWKPGSHHCENTSHNSSSLHKWGPVPNTKHNLQLLCRRRKKGTRIYSGLLKEGYHACITTIPIIPNISHVFPLAQLSRFTSKLTDLLSSVHAFAHVWASKAIMVRKNFQLCHFQLPSPAGLAAVTRPCDAHLVGIYCFPQMGDNSGLRARCVPFLPAVWNEFCWRVFWSFDIHFEAASVFWLVPTIAEGCSISASHTPRASTNFLWSTRGIPGVNSSLLLLWDE